MSALELLSNPGSFWSKNPLTREESPEDQFTRLQAGYLSMVSTVLPQTPTVMMSGNGLLKNAMV